MISRDKRLKNLSKLIIRLRNRSDYLKKRSEKFSFFRLLIFATGVILCIAGFIISDVIGWIFIIISLGIFSVVVHTHNKLIFGIRRCNNYLKIKEDHLARMNLDWDNIPFPVVNEPPDDQTIQKDLDLTGKRSLQQLIDICISFEGSRLLSKNISIQSPDFETIIENQNAIKDLIELSLFRDKFLLKAKMISKKILNCSSILNWYKTWQDINFPKWLLPVCFILIPLYMVLFLVSVIGDLATGWFFIFLIYFFIYTSQQKTIKKIVEQSTSIDIHLKKFIALVLYVGKHSYKEKPFLKKTIDGFTDTSKLKNLQRNINALLVRENPIIRLILNILFPYDIFFCKKLIRIKSETESRIPLWIKNFNELEYLFSLSNFAFLNPEYVFPEINPESKCELKTVEMGHPLLKIGKKICNDFSFNKQNEIVIITGSNMSGKSTFLKTVGINFCLAYAGAPVDAKHFRTSLYELFTCIKVNDSVSDGISYFYAEVRRLKELLNEFGNEKAMPVLFLIDEIFKGTNNRERLAGSKAFIQKLSKLNGTGLVSTHDLELINLADEIGSIANYHFKEDIIGDKMVFDYKINDGPCPTTNALKIMQLSGLLQDT